MSKYLMIQGSGSSFATNAIEQVQIAGSEVVVAPLSDVTGMYVKEDTGVVTSNSAQVGSLYPVEAGDVINIYSTKDADGSSAQQRYGVFTSSSISVGAQAVQYGTNLTNPTTSFSPQTITINTTGYLMVNKPKPSILPVTIVVKKVLQ